MEGQNSVWWPMRCNGVYIIRGSSAPFLASFLYFIVLCDIRVGSNFFKVILCEDFLDGIDYAHDEEFVWMVVLG